jgi:hypothetical protein
MAYLPFIILASITISFVYSILLVVKLERGAGLQLRTGISSTQIKSIP